MNNIKYFANPEVLCETEWVANNLDNPEIKILEVDYDVENAYKRVTFKVRTWFGGKKILMIKLGEILLIKSNLNH